jgi:7-keto-8-aminopelargonate synthetase-like enzyme
MMDAVIDELDGRMIRVGDRWLTDFASCNYLGFDLDREIIETVPAYLDRWGTHPSWSRLLGSPVLYEEVEERLTALLGSEDSLVLPTITHIPMSVIPLLAASGTVFLDARAHKTIYDGCQIAKARGAAVRRFRFEDPDHLDALLSAERHPTRLVCMDGVNSMTGNAPDLVAFAAVARRNGALLYVDDAHGFGVIGERAPDEPCPYGVRGNSIVRHAGESYDNVVLVGGFSKAYSSLLAFIACPTDLKDLLKVAAPPYLYSGPSPVASLATRGAVARLAWVLFLAVGGVLLALYLFVAPLAGSGPLMNVLGLAPVIAIVVGVRLHRPGATRAWSCFSLGFTLFWLGDLYTYSYPLLLGRKVPFPSLGDAAYLAVYPALIAGLLILARRRRRSGTTRAAD